MADQPQRDWAAQIADQIERVVGTVRDRTTRPALTVVRGIVFGIIALAGLVTGLVLISIVLIRILSEVTNHAWIAFLITSAVFLLAGAVLMLKARAAVTRSLERT